MTIENIKKIALEKHGKKLTDEEAAEYAEKYGKLADDELDNVSGGCGGESNYKQKYCVPCGVLCGFYRDSWREENDKWLCPECGKIYRRG